MLTVLWYLESFQLQEIRQRKRQRTNVRPLQPQTSKHRKADNAAGKYGNGIVCEVQVLQGCEPKDRCRDLQWNMLR